MNKDYYKTLGLSETASKDEIKKVFRKLAKQYHPDRNKGDKQAENRFKEISEAYETLSDDKKRSEYDTLRKYGAFAQAGGQGQAPFGFEHFAQRGDGSGFSFRTSRFSGQDGHDFDDIISRFFGQTGSSGEKTRKTKNVRGEDTHAEITASFWDAINGATRMLTLSNGRKLRVKIPRGIDDGGKIRLAEQGEPNYFGGNNGDLIITVKVMKDQQFERKGNDVYTSTTISFIEAIKGTKKEVKTLSKTIVLTIPAGTQPGTVMRLKGMGLSVNGQSGDQYVEIKITIPTNLTEKQKKLLEEWEEET